MFIRLLGGLVFLVFMWLVELLVFLICVVFLSSWFLGCNTVRCVALLLLARFSILQSAVLVPGVSFWENSEDLFGGNDI